MTLLNKYVPEDQRRAIERQQFLTASPRVGHVSNYAFPSVQINPSGVVNEAEDADLSASIPKEAKAQNLRCEDQSEYGHSESETGEKRKRGIAEIGGFGISHLDGDDDVAAYTCAINNSDLPYGCDCGSFQFFNTDGFVVLNPFIMCMFNGQHYHGGTAPVVSKDNIWRSWGMRCNIIMYPSKFFITGHNATLAVSPAPGNNLLVLRPEHHSPQ